MNKLAVYGTLKKGHCNFYFMKGCKFLGKGLTKDKFGMLGYNNKLQPKIYKEYNKGQVKVEVYEVSDDLLHGPLDYIENNGKWYQREPRTILLETESGIEEIESLIYIGLGDPGSDHIVEPNEENIYSY